MTKQVKNRDNKKRHIILILCVSLVFVVALFSVMALFLTKDNKPIKSKTDGFAAVQSDVPADANENPGGKFYFAETEMTLKAGESRSAEVVNETGSEGNYIWESSNMSVAFAEEGVITGVAEGSCDITVKISGTDKSAKLRVYVVEDKEQIGEHDITEKNGCTYIDGVIIANKTYSLPEDYDPGISQEALDAFDEMAADAEKEDLNIYISSDYRSYYDQERIYNNYVERDGKEMADTYSSRPGHSDHQTGLAFDLNSIDDSFGDTPESDWVAENAHKYGFIIRFPKGKEEYTGYQYEPWHIRYLGKDMAEKVYESGLSLEEFLGITSKYMD